MTLQKKLLLLSMLLAKLTNAALIITEIANRGTSNPTICNGNGNDWVEIFNSGPAPVDLFGEGYILYDDKGFEGAKAEPFFFPPNTPILGANEYTIVCTKMTHDGFDEQQSPSFGIGSDDTIALASLQNNNTYNLVSSVGPLPNTDGSFDVTYALNPHTGLYEYTSTPTPLAPNKITPLLTPKEQIAKRKAELALQNAMGQRFFNMDNKGYPVPDAMDPILDLHVTMEDSHYQYLLQNASYEVYLPFQSAKLTSRDDARQKLWSSNIPGRIRPKGQSSLYLGLCMGTKAIPFQLEFGDGDHNNRNLPFNNNLQNLTLFGVQKMYLRNHVGDNSYVRDWSYHRMAARFGLPHLRARQVRFLINGNLHGLYTLLEAIDQEYVFARSFPDYDPNNFALYQVKTNALVCGNYLYPGGIEAAAAEAEEAARLHDEGTVGTPPYAYERGEHRPIVEVLGPKATINECLASYFDYQWESYQHTAVAYVRYDQSCPDMLLGEGLIDLDLGTSDWDEAMKVLIPSMLGQEEEDVHTSQSHHNPNLLNLVDLDNLLKAIAFYAVTINMDSPLGNGNNYYWVQTGGTEEDEDNNTSSKWKISPYDFNTPRVVCRNTQQCEDHMVSWSIARPTCGGMEENPIVGPLLSDPDLFHRYLDYVKEFVDTIYGNETFQEQIRDQIQANDVDARDDFWSFGGIAREVEFSQDPAQWKQQRPIFPLIPVMKARSQSVQEQLQAIDIGTFPRGPHGIGVGGDYEPSEACPDWRLVEAELSPPPDDKLDHTQAMEYLTAVNLKESSHNQLQCILSERWHLVSIRSNHNGGGGGGGGGGDYMLEVLWN